jgi:hypothetical protein
MSIQTNFPAIKPTLLLDFANVEQLDPRITFSRASTATYYGTQTAKAEENLLTRSQDFNLWTLSNVTVGTDTDTAPDGTTTAEAIKEDSATAVHRIQQPAGLSLAASSVYTISIFVKQKTGSRFATIGFTSDFSNYASATFDLSAGTNTQTLSAGYTSVSATITASVSSWYRVTLTATTNASASATGLALIGLSATSTFASSSRGFDSYAGNNTSEILYWGAQLEQRSAVTAYTPTTTQAITNYVPQLLTAASGVARFDHNPTTFESLGLEIEEQRTNLETYSSDFSDAVWVKTDATIGSNVIIAPDGTLTGDKLIASATTTTHTLTVPSRVYTSGTAYSMSIYAKVGELNTFDIIRSGAGGWNARFNLATQTATDLVGGGTVSITSVGNGWFRCSMSWTSTSSTSRTHLITLNNPDGTTTFLGNGFSGMYFWGIQTEAGAFPTSYIPTVASQVTRAAEVASMTGTNFSSWYNQAEGSFYASVVLSQTPTQLNSQIIFVASDNTTSNRVIVSLGSGSSGNINALVTTGGVTQAQTTNGSLSTAGAYQYANAYKVNDFASVANGGVAATDTSGTIPVVDRLYLGVNSSGTTTSLTATIRKIAYYPLRVTNAQLQALTS